MVMRQSANWQPRPRYATSSPRLRPCPRPFSTDLRHSPPLLVLPPASITPWAEACLLWALPTSLCPRASLLHSAARLRTAVVTHPDPQVARREARCLYRLLPQAYQRDHRRHNPATLTRPTSTLEASDHREVLRHSKASRPPRLLDFPFLRPVRRRRLLDSCRLAFNRLPGTLASEGEVVRGYAIPQDTPHALPASKKANRWMLTCYAVT